MQPSGSVELRGAAEQPAADLKRQPSVDAGRRDLDNLLSQKKDAREHVLSRWDGLWDNFPALWCMLRCSLTVAKPLPPFPSCCERVQAYLPYFVTVFLGVFAIERMGWTCSFALGAAAYMESVAGDFGAFGLMVYSITSVLSTSVVPVIVHSTLVWVLNHSTITQQLMHFAWRGQPALVKRSQSFLTTTAVVLSCCYLVQIATVIDGTQRACLCPFAFAIAMLPPCCLLTSAFLRVWQPPCASTSTWSSTASRCTRCTRRR